jgi:hydroxyacylglutathione hydrolase
MKIAVLPVTPFQQNCAILWDEDTMKGAVIDPGGEVARILAEVERLGVTVERIVLTHGHIDHAAGAAMLKDALAGVPIEGPDERDKFLLDGLEAQGAKMGFPEARNVTPDRWLVEGDTVEMAGVAFDVLHCPGHTPGSLVFVNTAARFAFVGDVLFRGSVGRTDFPYGDPDQLIEAIETKLLPLGDDIVFLCGHGPGSSIGAERATNPFLRR